MEAKKKVVVLLSAGLDSTVNIFETMKHGHKVVLALTFDYGQKAAKKEIEQSAKIAKYLNVPHKVISLPWFKDFNSSLTQESMSVPTGSEVELESKGQPKSSVWVPNRNGIFLNIAAGYAEALGAGTVIPGFNREEAETFADNSRDFLERSSKALELSTSNSVNVGCYTIHMNKPELVLLGQGLDIPWELTWPCYLSEDKWCGECESCQRARRAFAAAKVDVSHLFKG